MSASQALWVGYSPGGGRANIELGGPGSKLLLLGSRASELAALVAVSAKEAEAKPVLFDLDGYLSSRLSGHLDTYDYRSFLYDAYRLQEPEAWHSQLAAAAYTVALNLSAEEEAIINSAMQLVASEGTLLSPASLHDVLGKVEGFRGFYVDKLSGRIGTLKHFDAADDQSFTRLMQGNLIVDFHRAPYPLAAELGLSLFLAKAVAMAHSTGECPGFILTTEAHRLFRSSPRPAHTDRLLVHFLGMKSRVAFATDQVPSLSPTLVESCPIRVYSGDAWQALFPRSGRLLPGTFMVDDTRGPSSYPVVPRRVICKSGDYALGRPSKYPNPELVAMILDLAERFPLSTPESVVNYLSAEFLSADISGALDALQRQRALVLEPKDAGGGPRVFCLTVTQEGRRLLQELRK